MMLAQSSPKQSNTLDEVYELSPPSSDRKRSALPHKAASSDNAAENRVRSDGGEEVVDRAVGSESPQKINKPAVKPATSIEDEVPVVKPVTRSSLALAFARVVHALRMRRFQDFFTQKGWVSPTPENPIWLLGECYQGAEGGEGDKAAEAFVHDFSSRLWFTYRKDFAPIAGSNLTSDTGWGCMLRSGQMLLAQALISHHLGRTFRRYPGEPHPVEYLAIVHGFGDSPDATCPFSIHRLVAAGEPHGLAAGAWLGPYAFCRTLEALARGAADPHASEEDAGATQGQEGENSSSRKLPSPLPMAVYVAAGDADGERGGAPVLLLEDVAELCQGQVPSRGGAESAQSGADSAAEVSDWGALLVLVPLHLGLEKVNPRYLPSLQGALQWPQSVGVLGGKPGGATYLVGFQDDQVLYLDPHEVQPVAVVSPDNPEADTSSYHSSTVRRIPLESIDPSLALGFYCRNKEEFEDFCNRARSLAEASKGAPLFTIGHRRQDAGEKSCLPSPSQMVDYDAEGLSGEGVDVGKDASGEDEWQLL